MQVLSHTFTYFSTLPHWTLRHLSYRDTSLFIHSLCQKAAWRYCKCSVTISYTIVRDTSGHCSYTSIIVKRRFFRMMWFTFPLMRLWTQRSPWSLSVMNIYSPIPKHCAPFSDTGGVHNMFAMDCNKSSVNFTGSNVFRLQKPNHASHLTVDGIWYRRVHCHNPLHSQREKVRCTNCTR